MALPVPSRDYQQVSLDVLATLLMSPSLYLLSEEHAAGSPSTWRALWPPGLRPSQPLPSLYPCSGLHGSRGLCPIFKFFRILLGWTSSRFPSFSVVCRSAENELCVAVGLLMKAFDTGASIDPRVLCWLPAKYWVIDCNPWSQCSINLNSLFVQSMLLLLPEGKAGEGGGKSHVQIKVYYTHRPALAHRARHFIAAGDRAGQTWFAFPGWLLLLLCSLIFPLTEATLTGK